MVKDVGGPERGGLGGKGKKKGGCSGEGGMKVGGLSRLLGSSSAGLNYHQTCVASVVDASPTRWRGGQGAGDQHQNRHVLAPPAKQGE